ncbi:MAG: peptidoglycan DD-metalloendopeptidase family protein [Patescibacteria group bacterium]|nr:peptidoglycan DD-metalloendopeptidase family protein [Patescibacteria group bacterium]
MKKTLNQNSRGLFAKAGIKVILVAFLASMVLFNIGPVAADELSDSIDAKKQEMNDVSQKINDLKNALAAKQKEISSLKNELGMIDSRVELIQLQIRSTQLEIEKNGAEIEQSEKDIKEKEDEIAKQKTVIATVIKKIYQEKDNNFLTVIIGSNNFSQLVEGTEYLSKINTKLKADLDKLNILKTELEQRKQDLEKKRDELGQLKKDKESEDAALEDQKYSKIKVMEMTKGQESEYQSKLAQANAEEQSVAAEITKLVQEQARRKRSEGVTGRDGRDQVVMKGGFTYPLAGLNRVSITGGDFMDPSYGMGFPHTGVDLAAAQGTPVMAAGPGTVVIAHDSGGGGLSYIAIDHGNGLVTKYLHVSAIYVSTGDVVNAGDVIGLSGGSPGSHGAGIFTTGAHLHFEIDDYNGNAVNPHSYLNIAPPLF